MHTKSGKALFPIGIGTWNVSSEIDTSKLESKYRGVKPAHGNEEAEIEAIKYSISRGQNHIDCAELYGGFYTDEVIGRALKGQKREDLYIADKLWKTSVGKGKVRPTVELMLQKLGINYLDMLYIHAPWDGIPWQEAISQIDELIGEGIVRDFGVSNFTIENVLQTLKMAQHPITANQMNYNVLYKNEVSDDFLKFCEEHDIRLVAYQPIKRQEVLKNPTIEKIARSYKVTPAQVALAWLLSKDSLPIPKATQRKHIDENISAIRLKLSEADMRVLDNL